MAFDITKNRATDTAEIKLKHGDMSPMLDDAGKPLSVTIYGPGAKQWRAAEAEKNRKLAARIRENGGRTDALLEDQREEQADFLAAITISFNGFTYPVEKGTPERDMFRALYMDDALGYVRDQVAGSATSWGSFTKASKGA